MISYFVCLARGHGRCRLELQTVPARASGEELRLRTGSGLRSKPPFSSRWF